ncbi:MAG: hypothetical protein FJX59_18460, partial [Alphaproteobacteria bacterium]|nr:hypothetical protein [Alphaproteobacteria bacterium]
MLTLAAGAADASVSIRVVSSDPTRVTGGDALIEISADAAPKVIVNDRDVTAAFSAGAVPGHYLGLVGGLTVGENKITASAGGSSA